MKQVMRNIFTILLLALICCITAHAQLADSIASRMALQRYTFPQEKVHVMTDKPRYMAGDTIWLRAWVVDAATHQPVNASQFVYIELQNPLDTVVTRIKLRQRDGRGQHLDPVRLPHLLFRERLRKAQFLSLHDTPPNMLFQPSLWWGQDGGAAPRLEQQP